jgi:hypothetical protein
MHKNLAQCEYTVNSNLAIGVWRSHIDREKWPMVKKEKEFPTNEFDAIIGKNVRYLVKEKRRVSNAVEKLAEIMDTTTGHVSDLLNGKRRWNTSYMKLVCDHFGCSASELLEGATPRDRQPDIHQQEILNSYYSLGDDDRRVVDKFLFGGKKSDPPLTPPYLPQNPHHPERTKK